ncbi:MAG: YbaB/EbfC family nucleoid-associated protein [Solirubrobacterales bacterium]
MPGGRGKRSKGGGLPGGMGAGAGGLDVNALMKQAQEMQTQMQENMASAQEELKDEIVEASAGGGMVKATMSGDLVLKSVEIDPDAVDPEDVEMLQDMVMAAINEVLRAAQERADSKMGGLGGDLPGGLGDLGLPGM